MHAVATKYEALTVQNPSQAKEYDKLESTELLETSYAGILGKTIEPVIRPLGYDWKIGIALITSFAAREVFVGTMATLYSVGDDADENSATLREKMNAARWPNGDKVYTLAAGLSLLVFYALAMQCMSTLAVVKRENRSWKWPLIMLGYMTGLAYLMSFIAYQLFK
jgi:ferrous iron transport protein B